MGRRGSDSVAFAKERCFGYNPSMESRTGLFLNESDSARLARIMESSSGKAGVEVLIAGTGSARRRELTKVERARPKGPRDE